MNLTEWARNILEGESLEDKLMAPPKEIKGELYYPDLPLVPARSSKIKFSDQNMKFPKKENLHLLDKKALALNSFANHELLAIEMMANALLQFKEQSDEDRKFKIGIINTIKDEQKHFKLYVNRMQDLGYEFGDFPLNDFFWKQMQKIKTPESFIGVMSLTFESANLDFALYYKKIFESLGDHETAKVLEVVYQDEISHVAFGVFYADKWKKDKSLWDYYLSVLPFPLTPARSKGIGFDEKSRLMAGYSKEFINSLKNYSDSFHVTKRNPNHEK